MIFMCYDKFMEVSLMSIVFKDKQLEVCENFSLSTNIGLSIIDNSGNVIYKTKKVPPCFKFCSAVNEFLPLSEKCRMSHLYGGFQAQRFGGRYIYFCHFGFVYFMSPIGEGTHVEASLMAGPLLMVEHEEFFIEDIIAKHDFPKTEIKRLRDLLEDIPYIIPERVHAMSEMLYICANNILEKEYNELQLKFEKQKLQGVISDYIMQIKKDKDSKDYPLDKEEELLFAMSSGDVKGAKALLNEMLGYIFFYSGFNFEIIRSRILELIVLLSRAAVKGGADAELIFGLNFDYLKQIDSFDNVEDMAYWLSMIMNRFTEYVFNFVGVKHVDVIYKATDYIKTNYMNKITLEEVANYVYLCPTYFSKVFKEESGHNFNTFLNIVRVEKSKKLLQNENINIADISNMVGYEDQSYFSKVFKKLTGMTPLRYRQSRGVAIS